ncbi:PLD-like domain-containing protein [Phthorimaea operculella]|nr:PLD-like domain-containing protein [Phthorimaea operculella]
MVFCKLHYNPWSCFDKLISYIEAAKTSVSVCMPSIHNPAIQARLVKLLEETDIKVRIIIDSKGYKDSTDFLLRELIEAGAEIKCRVREPYNMQHKFCLIDDKVLMTGTLNWGDDRSCDNWNYVYVTNKPQLVEPVIKEFNQMWSVDIDLKEAFKFTYNISDSEDDTAEIQPHEDDDTLATADISIESQFQGPLLLESQPIPEVCIM